MKKFKLFILTAITAFITSFSVISCKDEPQPIIPATGTITFTYSAPDIVFDYLELDVCWNNDEGTDMVYEPMLENTFTVTYNVQNIPATYPVVFVPIRTNRPLSSEATNMEFNMKIEINVKVGNYTINETYTNKYVAPDVLTYKNNRLNSTYSVKIDEYLNVYYVAPQ